jgi:hypothetical protein
LKKDDVLMKCLYCRENLGPETEPAHVLPASFSGRKKSHGICCTECNRAISIPEGALWSAFEELSGAIGVVRPDKGSKRKKARPAVVDLPDGGRYSTSRGITTPLKGSPVEKDGAYEVRSPADLDLVALELAHLLRRTGKNPDDLAEGRVSFKGKRTSEFAPTAHFHYEFRAGPHHIAIAKMPLELLAYHQPELARRQEFESTRRYARYGEGDAGVKVDTSTQGSGLCRFDDLPPAAHLVEVWTAARNVIGLVRLYQHVQCTVLLADDYEGEPFRAAYGVDPIQGVDVLDVAEDCDGPLPADWPSRTAEAEVMQRWGQRFQEYAQEIMDEAGISAMSSELVEDWAATAGDVISPEDHRRFANRVAQLAMRLRFKEDQVTDMSDADMATLMELVRQHFERLAGDAE